MADKKISQLTDGTSLQSGDFVVVARSGDNFKVDPTQFGSDISLGDNVKAIFGAGSDLQIYHDGSNSYIAEGGTGNLQIQGQNLSLEDSTGTRFFLGIQGGETRLYNQGNQKVAITATGIDVTGTVTADGLTLAAGSEIASDGGLVLNIDNDSSSFSTYFEINADSTKRPVARFVENGDISFYEDTGTTPKFFWDASAESLGIGTTSPTSKLTVFGVGDVPIRWGNTSALGALTYAGSDPIIQSSTGNLLFYSASSERMRIDSSGNVGIGTSSPTAKLHVAGDNNGSFQALIQNSNAGASAFTHLVLRNDDNKVVEVGVQSSTRSTTYPANEGWIYVSTGLNLGYIGATKLYAGSAERARIDTSGNFGLGVTPSAWGSGNTALQIRSSGFVQQDNGTNVGLGRNAVQSGSWRYIADGYAQMFNIESDGAFKWFQAGSGTAGNTISFTQAMTLDTSGNLFVGATALGTVGSVVGSGLYKDGYVAGSADGAAAGYFARKTSDGNILEFRKGTSSVGNIGTLNGNAYITGASKGVRIGSSGLIPTDSSGANSDGTYDLGDPSVRFKDLYLSGGVYLGGTAAANLLDDYEEGTFTPVLADASSGGNASSTTLFGAYTKVGNLVYVSIIGTNVDLTGMTSGNDAFITGLPFTLVSSAGRNPPSFVWANQFTYSGTLGFESFNNTSYGKFPIISSASNVSYVTIADIGDGTADFKASFCYQAA